MDDLKRLLAPPSWLSTWLCEVFSKLGVCIGDLESLLVGVGLAT